MDELDQEGIDPSTGEPIAPGAPELGNDSVGVIGPDGHAGVIPRAQLAEALARGYRLEAPEQTDARMVENREEGRQAQTFIESAASTMTLGGTDLLAKVVAPEEAARMGARRKLNTEGTIAGAVLGGANPFGVGGLITGAGKAVGAGVAGSLGGGVAGRIAGGAAQVGTEGALFGYGEGISQIGLTPGPLTAEQVVSTLGGNILYGAGLGVGLGGAGAVLGEAARAGRSAIAKVGTRAVEEGAVEIAPEVAAMDRQAAKSAHELEAAALGQARDVELRETYKAAREFNEVMEGSWLKGGDSRFKRLMQSTRKGIRNSLDSENSFVRYKGARTLDALDKQAQAIREYAEADIAARQKAATALGAEEVVKSARAESLRKGETVSMRTPDAPVSPPKIEMDPKVADMLEVNDALRKRIEGLGKAPTSPKLEQLAQHIDNLAHPGKKPAAQMLAEQMGGAFGAKAGFAMGGMPGGMIGYHLGSKAASAVFERGLSGTLRRGVAKSQKAMTGAIDGLLSTSTKVLKGSPVLATRVLSAASFATPERVGTMRPGLKSTPIVAAYRQREAELRSQMTMGPTGKPVMSPSANGELHQRLAGLWAVDPQMADQIETAARRRLEFLAEKLPPRPSSQAFVIGEDRFQQPDMAMRKFARYIEATENPNGVLDRLGQGKMTPEDAEAFRVTYPEMWNSMRAQIMARLPEVRGTLPFRKRLMLSLFFNAPVDSSLEPANAKMLQQTFAAEPGTQGGTGQPVPHLGNTKKLAPDPTPAQRMSG